MKDIMKKLIVLLLCSTAGFCQTAKTSKPVQHPTSAKTSSTAAASTGVTNAEVESFLQKMFGFQTGATWKVADIAPSAEDPAVTRVVVQLGEQSQVLYVLPGGKFAMVGEIIPFGADPFAPVRSTLTAGANGPVMGNKEAAVTLVEFSDLQCPHCKVAQPIIEKLVNESPNAKLIYQPFPLPMHPWAKQAAAFAECVRQQDQDAMWKFTDSVYAAQADITETNATEKLAGLATSAGADAAKTAVCAVKPETMAKIQKSIDLGLSVGVGATPTLYIDGRKVLGISDESFSTLKAMVDYEAKQPPKK
jgi:protein-disulfide isomerase